MRHRWAAWLILLAGMVVCRALFLEDVVYNVDEAEYAVAADGIGHGLWPGVDFLGSTKPPGISVLYYLLFNIFGRNLAVLHCAHLVLTIATGVVLIELAVLLWGSVAAMPTALMFWMVSNSFSLPGEILALNVESPGILAALLGLWVILRKPRRRTAAVLSGVLIGIASLFRSSLVVFFAPALVIMLRSALRGRGAVVWLAAGTAFPWLATVVLYGLFSDLPTALDSWFRYPLTYATDLGIGGFFAAMFFNGVEFVMQAAVPVALTVCGAVLLYRQKSRQTAILAGWIALASVVALASGSRFFGHYFIQIYPVMGLLGAYAWLRLVQESVRARRVLVAALIIGSVIAMVRFPFWRYWDREAPPRDQSEYNLTALQSEKSIAEFAAVNTEADETILVWGYCPQIYYYAQRLPAVRDYLCHYITGYSPGSFDPYIERAVREHGHPQAELMFLDDVRRNQPKYIFDLVEILDYQFTFYNYSLNLYPQLAGYLKENYLPEGQIDGARIYRKRTPEDTWWPEEESTD